MDRALVDEELSVEGKRRFFAAVSRAVAWLDHALPHLCLYAVAFNRCCRFAWTISLSFVQRAGQTALAFRGPTPISRMNIVTTGADIHLHTLTSPLVDI
ncbi:hypothetical protein [Hydrocarboniphaga sp.]|uniref:hypothetical protein n=1 Tax=Hydrocarboniphaga sp. TaxID=2033016 RepID=UPI00261D7E37|nr:hypothetical protein [Hydrocarboniphaga sp.]